MALQNREGSRPFHNIPTARPQSLSQSLTPHPDLHRQQRLAQSIMKCVSQPLLGDHKLSCTSLSIDSSIADMSCRSSIIAVRSPTNSPDERNKESEARHVTGGSKLSCPERRPRLLAAVFCLFGVAVGVASSLALQYLIDVQHHNSNGNSNDVQRESCKVLPTEALLQDIMDKESRHWNCSFTMSLVTSKGRQVQIASGFTNREGTRRAEISDKYAYGSVTKMWTAAAVMKLYEEGQIDLDDKITDYLDPWMKDVNGTTLTNLYGNTDEIQSLTIAHLLSMHAGLHDYDSQKLENYQFSHPRHAIGPIEALYLSNRTFYCFPGASSCAGYSSTNFEILGLLLLQQASLRDFEDYDQLSFLKNSPNVVDQEFAIRLRNMGIEFPTSGTCSESGVISGWDTQGRDVSGISCVGGFTCGNLVGPSLPVAMFARHLFAGSNGVRPLSYRTVDKMKVFSKLPMGTVPGVEYGLGVMRMPNVWASGAGSAVRSHNVGHGGETYGFGALSGYVPGIDVGYAIAANVELVAPKSGTSRWPFNQHVQTAMCKVLQATLSSCSMNEVAQSSIAVSDGICT